MKPDQIFETVLYADDLLAMEKFYREVIGLEVFKRLDLAVVFHCGNSVLLIFDPEQSSASGRGVPSHGSIGPGHLAFGIRQEDLERWRRRLDEKGVEIEQEVSWGSGGLSIYFRDPAGNSIELAPSTLWGGGWSF